jgi:glutathione S-transferase
VLPEPIFHLALRREWEEARETGEYRRSTLGASLDEVGFIHCAERHQVAGVAERSYIDVDEPLVLLEIDPVRAGEVVWEDVAGVGESFPHLYGPLRVDAVLTSRPFERPGTRPATQD